MLSSGRRETHLLLMVLETTCFLATSVKSSPVYQETEKLTPELSFQVKLHGILLWASTGFLMPVGIVLIRISNRVQCGRKLKILFYSHVIVQMFAVLLATGAAVLSIKEFDNSFSNTHQRLGLGLYGLILAQPLIGFLRPRRGVKVRSIWYTTHWLLGTAISIIGIINIYLGLHAYDKKTTTNLRIWTTFFTIQIVMIAFMYLLQDRMDYIKKQGVVCGDEQISPSDIRMVDSPSQGNHKDFPARL